MEDKKDHFQGSIYMEEIRSEEVRDIITAVPSWIIRYGIILTFLILIGIIMASSLISYPDIVSAKLKVTSLNAPKAVIAKKAAKITNILVSDGGTVAKGQVIAYLEAVGEPADVLKLNQKLKGLQSDLMKGLNIPAGDLPINFDLGELQQSYQAFYQQYLQYRAAQKDGYYQRKMAFLQRELKGIDAMTGQINGQRKIQELERKNQEMEYNSYKKLYHNKIISRSEFVQQENKYFESQYPLQQTEASLLSNRNTYSAKEKELLDLRHVMEEEQAKFIQALNQCVNESNSWILQNVLTAPIAGKLNYAGIIQQNQNLTANQEVFIVNPGSNDYFGELQIPQYNMGKVKKGQLALIKLHSFPFEQYGMVRGHLTAISDVAYRDSVFIARVSFDKFEANGLDGRISLKNGMSGDVDLITQESSLLQRFLRTVLKVFNSRT